MYTRTYSRKLAAIFYADVEGYCRLMENDEYDTIQRINEYREYLSEHIKAHNGRVLDTNGDSLLAEFSSVMESVLCARDVQKELRVRNSGLSEDQRMEFRIGINVGDVIEDGKTIYGNSVNIAARLQALAESGGICISGTVFDHLKSRLDIQFNYTGEKYVKNIKDPVRVYMANMENGVLCSRLGDVPHKLPQLLH